MGVGAAKAPKAKKAKGGKGGAVVAPVARKDKGDMKANHHAWGIHPLDGSNWRFEGMDDNPGVFIINVKAYFWAAVYLMMGVLYEVCATIFANKNFKISNDRMGLTRSAILLILFIVIHAVGNLHVFMGPDDFNGYGYFYVRLYWTGFGLPANIVDEYLWLSVLLHVFVGLKRTWDMKLTMGIKSGQLNLAITGLCLLAFMTVHLFQFRFGDTDQFGPYYVNPPRFPINFFWCEPGSATTVGDILCDNKPVGVRDIYALEFQIFQNPLWTAFYIFSVVVFMTHACFGWENVTPALGIPKGHQDNVKKIGYAIMITIGLIYISFPAFVVLTDPFKGHGMSIQAQADRVGA